MTLVNSSSCVEHSLVRSGSGSESEGEGGRLDGLDLALPISRSVALSRGEERSGLVVARGR